MRWGPTDRLWVVVNPGPSSVLEDVLFEASLAKLALQFKGGLTIEEEPTLFTSREEAEVEARGRLMALQIARIVRRQIAAKDITKAAWIKILDGDGQVLLEEEIGEGALS